MAQEIVEGLLVPMPGRIPQILGHLISRAGQENPEGWLARDCDQAGGDMTKSRNPPRSLLQRPKCPWVFPTPRLSSIYFPIKRKGKEETRDHPSQPFGTHLGLGIMQL